MNGERYINSKEVALILGVSHKTVYEWAALGKLPSYKFGRSLRFKEADVYNFAGACKKKPFCGGIKERRCA